jgi:uncharacterized membrane protein YhaH (DUF805 family)
MLGAIKYNLSHLLDFTGRDARQTFWYYVLFLVVINFAIGMVVAIPMTVGAIGTAVDAARSGASEEAMQAQMMSQMSGTMGGMVWVSLVTSALMGLLLLASFVRRLHDSDKSGWWAALALAGHAAGMLVSLRMMDVMQDMLATPIEAGNMQAMIERQQEVSAYGLAGWIGPIVVIVFGVMKSTDGPNRFGDHPVRF